MSEVTAADILSLVIYVAIHAGIIFVAYSAGHNDGWRKGYLDRKDFDKTIRDTLHASHNTGGHYTRR